MLDITHIFSNDPSFHLSENIKVALVVKNLLAEEELVLQETQEMWVQSLGRSGRSPGGGHGNSLQYSCLESPLDRGARWAMVHRITESNMTDAT